MKTLIAFICIFFSVYTFGQNDTTIFIGINGKLVNESAARRKQVAEIKSKKKMILTTYNLGNTGWEETKKEIFKETEANTYQITSGGLKMNTITRNYVKLDEDLYKFTEISENKIIRTGFTRTIIPIILQGEVIDFYQNGNKQSVSEYENNELVSNKNWLEDGQEYYENIFYSVDNAPFYIPGNNRLHEHILKILKENEVDFSTITGNMVVGFVVFSNGTIGGFRIVKGIQANINQLVISALSSLNGEWQPARLNNETVCYFQLFPVNFLHNSTRYDNLEMEGGVLQWNSN